MSDCCDISDCCSSDSYDIGSSVTLSATFTNPASTSVPVDPITGNTLINPDDVFVTVLDPSGTSTTYSGVQLTNPNTGYYSISIGVSLSGVWTYRWFATGNGQSAKERTFEVRRSTILNE